jgi:hypothetical protein
MKSHATHAPKSCATFAAVKPILGLLVFSVLSAFGAEYGPAVGTTMPAFEAPDQNGKMTSLKDVLGPNGAALVFFRSADW